MSGDLRLLMGDDDFVERLRELMDIQIIGEGRITVHRSGSKWTVGERRVPKETPVVTGAAGDLTVVQVELDTTTASQTGGPSSQCAYRYYVYPRGVPLVSGNRLYATSIGAYYRRDAIGAYDSARNGSLAELVVLSSADPQGRNGPLLYSNPDERRRWEACS